MIFKGAQDKNVWKSTCFVEDKIFINEELSRLNLVGTYFKHVKFVRCTFDNCDFSHGIFERCDVYDCTFNECVFYFCQFEQCELTKSRFASSFLSGVRFRSCDYTRTQFGEEFVTGVNRKIMEVPQTGVPHDVLVCQHAGTIPQIRTTESSHSGIAVEGCRWYIHFLEENSVWRDFRRRSILAANIANQLQAFGRGDSSRYHYLARRFAAKAEPKRVKRFASWLLDMLWGFGYHPSKLFWVGAIVNVLAIIFYWIITILKLGGVMDGGGDGARVVVDSIGQYLYYCVVVATTLGFGDLVPYGYCRAILVAQVLANLVLIALWLSIITSPHREWSIPEDIEVSHES